MSIDHYVRSALSFSKLKAAVHQQTSIGDIRILDNQTMAEQVIDKRRRFVSNKVLDLHALSNHHAINVERNRQILPYDRYLSTIKNAASLRKAMAEVEQGTGMPKAPYRSGHGLEDKAMADLFARKTGLDLNKIWRAEERSAKAQRDLYSANDAATLALARDYDADYLTPDWMGYLRYVGAKEPKLFELLNYRLPVTPETRETGKHTYITGGSGSGKSELLKVLVHKLASKQHEAVIVLDPHGDLVRQIGKWDIFKDSDRLVYIDPFLIDNHVPTMNPLDVPASATMQEREVIGQQLVNVFEQLLKGSAGTDLTVNMRSLLMPCILTLIDKPNSTLIDLQRFMDDLRNSDLVALGKQSNRGAIARFFHYDFVTDATLNRSKAAIGRKLQSIFNSFAFDETINGATSFNLEQAINERKVILFNLAKGRLGDEASEALGRFVLASVQGLAFRRENQPEDARVPLSVFVDECQNYISPATVSLLEETRKYGVNLTLAQQVAGRGMTPEIRTVVLNNTNIKLAGRTPEDDRMAKLMGKDLADIQGLETGVFLGKVGNGLRSSSMWIIALSATLRPWVRPIGTTPYPA